MPSDAKQDGRFAVLDDFLRSRRRFILVGLALGAVALRGFVFIELTHSPTFWLHEWPQSDMSHFHTWATAIAEGDVWSRTVRPPLDHWHTVIADDYAAKFPEKWAALLEAYGGPDGAARGLWNRWCGGGRFYQEPLYPYLVAASYAALAPAVAPVFIVQMLAGVVALLLIHHLARRCFGDAAALMAALLALLYGPEIFYENVLLRDTLIGLVGLVLAALLLRAIETPTWPRWLLCGLVGGAALLLKGHFAIFLLGAMCLAVAIGGNTRRVRASSAVWLLGGVVAGLSPLILRNAIVGVPLLAAATNAGPTYVATNSENSTCATWDLDHAAEILEGTHNALLPTIVATLRTHPSVGHYLRLAGSKALAALYWFEEPNNTNFYFACLYSEVLAHLPVSFGVISALAVTGMVLSLRNWRRTAPLLLIAAANFAVLILFFVQDRFRLALALVWCIFAGAAAAAWLRSLVQRRWLATLGIAAGVTLTGLWSLSPLTPGLPRVGLTDVKSAFAVYYAVQLQAAEQRNDPAAAADILADAMNHQPPEVRALGPDRPAISVFEADLAEFYATVFRDYAQCCGRAGRPIDPDVLRRADQLDMAAQKP